MSSVRLEHLSRHFPSPGGGEVIAVDAIDLDIASGELLTLLGPSGCGKTTLLRMIGGFETPTSGRVIIDDRDVTTLPPERRDTAMVFQSYALFPHLTVRKNVAYGLELRGVRGARLRERVDALLEIMGLGEMAARMPAQLSGGQQQRVALTRALIIEPSVLLFDEPLSNLDAKLRVQMRTEIRRTQRRLGITSVYVTHDQEEAMSISDRIAILRSGQIEQIGTPIEIYGAPATKFAATFMGHASFLPARVGECGVEVLGARFEAANARPAGPALAVVRPESIDIRDGPWRGTVTDTVYLGHMAAYELEVGDACLTAHVSDPQRHGLLAPGTEIALGPKGRLPLLPPDA